MKRNLQPRNKARKTILSASKVKPKVTQMVKKHNPSSKPIPISPIVLKPSPKILPPLQSKIIRPPTITPIRSWPKFYHGDNIHSYTQYINEILPPYINEIKKYSITDQEFIELEVEMHQVLDLIPQFDIRSAWVNMKRQYKNQTIIDPELPGVNCAVLLKLTWIKLKQLNEPTLFLHFKETLYQIGSTCLVGISHRLFMDFIVFIEL